MTIEEVLLERGLLEKATTIRRFEYSPLASELKKDTDIAKKTKKNPSRIRQADKFDETINTDDKKTNI